jgi:DNA-binding GntR family transcriptional regulator
MATLKRIAASLGREYESLSNLVYKRIRDEILWGVIPPGSTLTVRGLAERLAVSPMPVRDALQRLASEELVEISPRSSTRVAQISPETIEELYLLRRHLEPLAARLALPHLTSVDIRRLKSLLQKLEAAARDDDPGEWHRWNQEFHFLIFRRSGNVQLERVAQNLWDRQFLHFAARAVTQSKFRDRRAMEHRTIVQAIVKGDADATEEAWRDHLVQSETEAVAHLRQLTPGIATRPERRRRHIHAHR